ncbi:MAG: methylated-DNA--[protein]-cysteine S-methyltransferase [Planctomycetota bacterium]
MSHTSFLTALGVVKLAWTPKGLLSLRWGEGHVPPGDEAPAWVGDLARRVRAHLAGEALDAFLDVAVDDSDWTPFDRKVFGALRQVGPGQRVTYGELARRAGSPGAARAVGGTLGRNPVPLIVPCHRVVRSDGTLGGFSAAGGPPTKARLLELEVAS